MKKLVITSIIVLVLAIGAEAAAMASNYNSTNNNSSISDPIENLTQNRNFANHGFEANELKDELKVNKPTAIEKAKEIVGSKISQEAKKITAVKVKFTDNETPQLPEKNILLRDYPVWVVTFHGVSLPKNGPKNNSNINRTVLADKNVVIDANTGEELEIFSYNSSIK